MALFTPRGLDEHSGTRTLWDVDAFSEHSGTLWDVDAFRAKPLTIDKGRDRVPCSLTLCTKCINVPECRTSTSQSVGLGKAVP